MLFIGHVNYYVGHIKCLDDIASSDGEDVVKGDMLTHSEIDQHLALVQTISEKSHQRASKYKKALKEAKDELSVQTANFDRILSAKDEEIMQLEKNLAIANVRIFTCTFYQLFYAHANMCFKWNS